MAKWKWHITLYEMQNPEMGHINMRNVRLWDNNTPFCTTMPSIGWIPDFIFEQSNQMFANLQFCWLSLSLKKCSLKCQSSYSLVHTKCSVDEGFWKCDLSKKKVFIRKSVEKHWTFKLFSQMRKMSLFIDTITQRGTSNISSDSSSAAI